MTLMVLKNEQQDMLLLLGWLQLQCGQPNQARILLEALLCADPGHRQGRRALVVSLLKLGMGGQAEQRCNELLSAGENRAALWLCLSRARQLGGQIEEARSAYQQFLINQEPHERLF
jgi:type III secretion protein Y